MQIAVCLRSILRILLERYSPASAPKRQMTWGWELCVLVILYAKVSTECVPLSRQKGIYIIHNAKFQNTHQNQTRPQLLIASSNSRALLRWRRSCARSQYHRDLTQQSRWFRLASKSGVSMSRGKGVCPVCPALSPSFSFSTPALSSPASL